MSQEDVIQALIANYFPEENKIVLREKEYLMYRNDENKRLFYIRKGRLASLFRDENNVHIEHYIASEGMFLGVYSFFSGEGAYSSIKAKEDCELLYFETESEETKYKLIPILIHELNIRQKLSHQLSIDRQVTLKRLIRTEKMVTLGQLSAGLAHELNNAVGTLSGKTSIIKNAFQEIFKDNELGKLTCFNPSKPLSTRESRILRKEWEKYGISPSMSRKIAMTGLTPGEISRKNRRNEQELDRIYQLWLICSSLHDMEIASQQSVHVLQSIKQLGKNSSDRLRIDDLNDTIHDALALLTKDKKGIAIDLQLNPLPPVKASKGEMQQVWINVIKNACEALKNHHTEKPKIIISSEADDEFIFVKITDNGPGINEKIMEKIFQPNFTTKKEGLNFGLGLGLSIVQKIIESYDGKVKVESEPGNTSFIFEIPLKKNYG